MSAHDDFWTTQNGEKTELHRLTAAGPERVGVFSTSAEALQAAREQSRCTCETCKQESAGDTIAARLKVAEIITNSCQTPPGYSVHGHVSDSPFRSPAAILRSRIGLYVAWDGLAIKQLPADWATRKDYAFREAQQETRR